MLKAGAYALIIEIFSVARPPFVGEVEIVSRSRLVAELAETEAGWVQTQRLCGIDVEGGRPAKVEIPPSFVEAYPVASGPVALTDGHYHFDPGPIEVNGDWETDGHPGATITLKVPILKKVELYVTQETHTVLDGQIGPEGVAGEAVLVAYEQQVLGASHPWFERSRQPTPVRGAFRMAPVAETSCESVIW